MSERYFTTLRGARVCIDCGCHIQNGAESRHGAFHDRIDRLATDLIPPPRREATRITEADIEQHARDMFQPECPFPMGAKVRTPAYSVNAGVEGQVTDWKKDEESGEWYVVVRYPQVGGVATSPENLELVPEPEPQPSTSSSLVQGSGNPDTPPSAENPDKPLVCAVCGEPVYQFRNGALAHHAAGDGGGLDGDHAADLTPPEPKADHPFLPQIMQGRPRLCEECGEHRDTHTEEYDISGSYGKGFNPFTDPLVVPIVKQPVEPPAGTPVWWNGYAAALRDAVEAVKAVEHWASYNTTDDATYYTFVTNPVAAIEALNGNK